MRFPLSYLCDGTALPEGGSRCGEGNTCNQGTCGSAELPSNAVPRYEAGNDQRTDATRATGDGGLLPDNLGDAAPSGCFDVAACFATAQGLDIDVTTCSVRLPPPAAGMRVSVALMLPLGDAGICENGACYVPLDLDAGGYSFGDGGEVLLPAAVCDKLLAGVPLRAAVSSSCGEKSSKNPPCGPWSSVQTPLPVQDTGSSMPGTSSAPSLLGGACDGSPRQACGKCGTQARACHDGNWDEWGACMHQGTCIPAETELCGRGGSRACGGNCEWAACLTQTCSGSSSQSCGNCGTQTRTCDNGAWSEWSPCNGEGECALNMTRDCGTGGKQACGGSCRWGSCGNQSCDGAPSEACGKCGTHTRACDAASGTWSTFGACTDEGECMPNTTRDCGTGGKRACRGDCRLDSVCAGQTCIGESTRACQRCGTHTRSCDTNAGQWGEWSPCTGQGECTPNETRDCGTSGKRVCGGNCRWDEACTGQTCAGVSRQNCGNCGTQSRTCDTSTGTWSGFSACMNEGACRPGDTRDCGTGGSRTCTTSCQWPEACTMQRCAGPAMQACGNCGTQTRACDTNTGQYGPWSACMDEKACRAGSTRDCGGTGKETCSSSCEFSGTCECPAGQHLCNGSCVSNTLVTSCGDSCTPCPAAPGGTPTCVAGRCGINCGALTACGNSCFDVQTDAAHCGDCTTACPRGESCVAGRCACPTGEHRCAGRCVRNDSPATCGEMACSACTAPPGATATCDGKSCGFTCTTGSMCKTGCADLRTDNSHCGTCENLCMDGRTCQAGQCLCPPTLHECNGKCVKNDALACGDTCTRCSMPEGGTVSCNGTSCVPACPAGTHDCGGACVPDASGSQCGPDCVQCPGTPAGVPVCRGGACAIACEPGYTECTPPIGFATSFCADLTIDINHCGACFRACNPVYQYCSAGNCVDQPIL